MSQMNQKELQSYFASLCKSFYIVYKQVKRLEKEVVKLKKTDPKEELKVVNELLEMPEQNKNWQKYITSKCSKEELQAKEKELKEALKEYNQGHDELIREIEKWDNNYKIIAKAVEELMDTLRDEEVTVKVSSKDEIYALMCFYRENSVIQFRVIDTDEKALKSFPSDKKKYQEFYEAYCVQDIDAMDEVCRKYY